MWFFLEPFTHLQIALITIGAFAGGFVNGLTGFGTGLTAMPFWLQVLPAGLAAQLAAAGGVVGQLTTLRTIWHAIDWRALAPMLGCGLAGVPLGAALLPYIDQRLFKQCVALILIIYSVCMLLGGSRLRVRQGGRAADGLVGFIGGILGGLAGLSGVSPTIWAAIQGWSKERRRGVFQAFNLTILLAMLVVNAVSGLVTSVFISALVLALPGTFAGVYCGQQLYARLDDRRFDRLVLIFLGVAGVGLFVTSIPMPT